MSQSTPDPTQGGAFQKLNELMGISPASAPSAGGLTLPPEPSIDEFPVPTPFKEGVGYGDGLQEAQDDYTMARNTAQATLERAQQLLELALKEAVASGGHPRSVEVANQVMKGVMEATIVLMRLQEKQKKLREGTSITQNNKQVNNTVIVTERSTLDVLRALKAKEADAAKNTIEGEFHAAPQAGAGS